MANDLNRCDFIGRLGKDPVTRFSPNGKAVCNFTIAVGKKWKDKNSGEIKEATSWVPIVAFGKQAEVLGEYLKKGSRLHVAGEFQVRKWQDQSGQNRYSTEIILNTFQFLDSRGSGSQSGSSAPEQAPAAAPMPDDGFDDGIPF